MKNKKVFIIIFSTILIILISLATYLLFFRNQNIESPNNIKNPINNNQETSSLELENTKNNNSGYTEEEKNLGLNVEIPGFKYCRYDEECFKELFLHCDKGNHIHFLDETSPYNFNISSKVEENCYMLIQNLKDNTLPNVNCTIPVSNLSEENMNNFLNLDNNFINKYCK